MAVEASTLVYLLCFIVTFSHTSGEQLLHSVLGEVGRGNYTYYSLMYDGSIVLYLHTKSGDADLYISQVAARPTYEPDNYCLQSSTCGLDIVHIPASFTRPVGIGVYGHVSHEISNYLLEVFYKEEDEEEFSGSYNEQSDEDLDSAEGQSLKEKQDHTESRTKEPVSHRPTEKNDKQRKSSKRKHNNHHPLEQIWR